MVRKIPLRVRYQACVQDRAQIKGCLQLHELPRLKALCLNADAMVEVFIEFGLNTDYGCSVIKINLQTVLPLQCQRCLVQFAWHADLQSELAIVRSESQAQLLPRATDYCICSADELELVKLIEDELLLALPQNPVHNNLNECDPEIIDKLQSYSH